MTSPRIFLVLPLLVSLTNVGCGQQAPRPSEVQDLRVLGIQASPPEIQVDRISDWDAPHTRVRALLVNPERTPVNYTWRFCPIESEDSCGSIEESLVPWNEGLSELAMGCSVLLAPAEGSGIPEPMNQERWTGILAKIRALASATQSGTAEVIDANSLQYDLPPFDISLLKELPMYLCMTDLFGAPVGWRPSVVLEVSNDTKTLIAQKRLNLTLADLTTPTKRELFGMVFGLQVCSEELTDNCLPFASSGSELNTLNQNPIIAAVERSYSDLSSDEFCDLLRADAGTLEDPCLDLLPVEVEKKLPFRFLPVIAKESEQNYQVLQTDIEERRLEIRNLQEDISISWFTSAGEIRDELTWPKFTKTLDTVYTPPKKSADTLEGKIWLWMVARDQRGGASWTEIPMVFIK
jgi:hypothetical protein